MNVPNTRLVDDMVPYDSRETWQEYHLTRIKSLEAELNNLNLLEHPCEIKAICTQIIAIKELLRKISPVTE